MIFSNYIYSKGSVVDFKKWNQKVSEVDFDALGFELSSHTSPLSIGRNAKFVGAKLSASIFEVEVGVGLSSEIGIVDDSISAKIAGTGCGIGKKENLVAVS